MKLIWTYCEKAVLTICGYSTETSLETCGSDLNKLWSDFEANKKKLTGVMGEREDLYGLMWKTGLPEGHYYYLLGFEGSQSAVLPQGTECQQLPPAGYIRARVPSGPSAFD